MARSYGQAPLHPMWGAGLAGLADSGFAISLRAIGAGKAEGAAEADDPVAAAASALKWTRAAEFVGLLAGAVAGGILAIFPRTRDAGFTGLAAAVSQGGPRALEVAFIPKEKHGLAILGMVMAERRTGLAGRRGRSIRIEDLGGNNYGMVIPEQRSGLAQAQRRDVHLLGPTPGGGSSQPGPLPHFVGAGYGTTGLGHRYGGGYAGAR